MYLDYKKTGNSGSNILILHGLFGNKRNWQSIANYLSTDHQVYTLDLRNHGNSDHANEMTYPIMATDVVAFIKEFNLSAISLIGHSMGGKVAMYLALNYPHLIKQLVIVDIAPVIYTHDFSDIFNALLSVPLAQIQSRKEAENYLIEKIDNNGVRQFLLQNLCLQKGKNFWRFNLLALKQSISQITSFPVINKNRKFSAATLFLGGQQSNYINDHNKKEIKHFFPEAKIVKVKAAGHWLHAEKPEIVKNILSAFLM